MGFGGAFVALADDATAALANPAGLVQLLRPEVAIEGRRWAHATPYTERGRAEGSPSGFGLDNIAGLETATSETTTTSLSFLSVTYPRERWAIAFFRHQLADFEFSGETQGLFGGGTNCCQRRIFDQRARTDFEIVSYGVSAGYRIGERFALGVGVIYHEVVFASQATMYLPDEDLPAGFFGPTSFFSERSLVTETVSSTSDDWAVTGGLLWRFAQSWTLGGVYRQGPEARLGVERIAGEAAGGGVPPGEVLFRVSDVQLDLPGLVGLGCAYRAPNDRLTVSFQWDRVDYSSIVESLGVEDQTVDDADELHLGAEYVFLNATPVVGVRVGAWLDPDHQVRSTSDDPFLRALLPQGDDEMHYAAGLGLAFESFQLDVAIDLAERVNALSLSAVYSF